MGHYWTVSGCIALMIAVIPHQSIAQGGELSQCRALGQEANYPCELAIADGVVRDAREHARKLRRDARAVRRTQQAYQRDDLRDRYKNRLLGDLLFDR